MHNKGVLEVYTTWSLKMVNTQSVTTVSLRNCAKRTSQH